MIRTDLHVHSSVSPDSEAPMADTARVAVERGVDILCFTDHCDLISNQNPGRQNPDCYDIWAKSYGEIEAVRSAWGDKLEILHGMELAEIVQDEERAREYAASPGLDFLIGSVHAVTGRRDFYYLDFPDLDTCRNLTAEYLDDNIRMAEMDLADVVAHIGYTNRYMGRRGFRVDLMEFADRLEALFSILVRNGRGIEVNTSGLRQGAGCTFPDLDVLKLYRQCGGEIVTVGSDSHVAADVASHIDEGQALLREAGFTYMTVFRQREPKFIKL